ncbi:MAG: leucine-rich repeat protein [Oscillospiraceae bacterium]|nr:leucine-rich repeat protein [Oscillospiraceae bacterium]
MKKASSVILFLALIAAMVFALSASAFAEEPATYTYEYGKLELGYKLYTGTKEASVYVVKVLNGTESTVEVKFPETITVEEINYKVTQIGREARTDETDFNPSIIPTEFQQYVSKVTIPEGINYIRGNLYTWKYEADDTNDYYVDVSAPTKIPDTDKVLSNIPAYVKNNYTDGALYINQCLVRVKPDYSGDFTVKSGTVCILAGAFEGCSNIGKVTLPDSVEFIGTRAFANSSVTSVNIPSGLYEHSNTLYNYTFYNCTKLEEVSIGCELQDINLGCFQNCAKLKGFDFGKVKGTIYARAFAGAFDPAENITLDLSGNTFAGYGEFAGSGIAGVKLPAKLDFEMFRNCAKLSNVVWNATITSVEVRAFENCTSLTADFGADTSFKAKSLLYRCFANTGFTEVTLPECLNSVHPGVFADNEQLVTLNWAAKNLNLGYPLFAILNDCTDGGSAPYMTKTTTNLSSTDYCAKPDKNGHTFITTLNLQTPDNNSSKYYFSMQPYLETVNYRYDVTEIPSQAFHFSPSLKNVTFTSPDKISKIKDNAFAFCPSLTSFPFEDMTELKEIQRNAFLLGDGYYSSKEVKEMTGDIASYGLKEINLGKTKVEAIGNAAFQNQIHAASLVTPATLTKAQDNVFIGNTSMEAVTINGPVSAFQKVEVSGSWTSYYGLHYSFAVKPSDTYYEYKYSDSYTPYSVGCVNDVIKTFSVPNAGECVDGCSLFSGFTGLETVTVGKMDNLPSNSFTNCINLKTVNLPDTKTFGSGAMFINCANLTAVNAPELTKLCKDTFIRSGIKSITADMMPKVTEIPYDCFIFCNDLTSVDFPKVTTVGANIFMECTKLKSVNMPELTALPERGLADSGIETFSAAKLNSIGENAFQNCSNLKSVSLPSLTTAAYRSFADCGLVTITADMMPKLETVETNAFQGCGKLKTVDITALTIKERGFADCSIETFKGAKLTTIEANAFQNSSNLISVDVPELTSTSYRSFADSGLKSLNAPKLATVSTNTFQNCNNLTSVNLPSLTTVNEGGFASCGLQTVTVSKDVTYGKGAFRDCLNLKTVIVEEGVTELSDFMFDTCISITTIKFPESLKTINWAAFKITLNYYPNPVGPFPRIRTQVPASVTLIDDDAFANREVDLIVMGAPFIADGHEGSPIGDNSAAAIGTGSRIYYKTEAGKTSAEDYVARTIFTGAPPEIIDASVLDVVYYSLSFNTDGGNKISSVTGTYGYKVDLTKYVPEKEGFEFGGWYSDSALTSPATEITLKGDMTVYAKWNEKGAAVLPFVDVKEADWSYDDIAFVFEKGLMNGTSETTFSPQASTTRGMIVTVLYRLAGEPSFSADCPFNDVAEGSYYEKAIAWAAESGIVTGYGDDAFGPDDSITREQMAAIFHRYAKVMGYDVSKKADLDAFADADSISAYALDAIAWAKEAGLVNGVSDTEICPRGLATREQAAAILHRFCDKIAG